MIYLQLFIEFFKTGLFALGGGLATLPFLMELTERYDWFTKAQLTDMIAVSESTPGPIGVNMATYAGFHTAGIPGAVTATMALVLPSILIIVLIAKFLSGFSENRIVQAVFYGIRPAVAALIASAVFGLFKTSLLLYTESGTLTPAWGIILLALITFVLLNIPRLKKLHPIIFLIFGAVMGILFRL
ncbi:chromate transporter [Diplocloster agilis]|uniref:Chromate transporter n=1 Tax=Diplocloster agilis TaxID=2850323 RepID=A0A949NC72_9FIRM|nr:MULTISPECIES: chromate transporter [Lachnospiraceae]MBU9738362.1 chromate transporter [Diplocloster agilis]MCU6734152.1 chromate transporter [Suonthocola fibrivorans]SCJ25482.1 chromate transporter%2C chromate ion transporter (CHR) family [uncultured Clostridium sp.]